MKILNLALAIAAPAMMSVGFVPADRLPITSPNNVLYTNNISILQGPFKLNAQPYYDSLFTKKELKQLKKAEKLRTKCEDALIEKAALETEANDLEREGDKSSKTVKKIAKLRAKAASKELEALKQFETAAATFKDIYTSELKNKLTDTSSARGKAASNLANQADELYALVDKEKKQVNTENALQIYRSMYNKLSKAVEEQELAFAIIKNDPAVDYTPHIQQANPNVTPSSNGNVAKEDLPVLRAPLHYDFANDQNIYRIRYNQFVDSLKVSDADKAAMQKSFDAEQTASQNMLKAFNLGSHADSLRVYASEALTLTEKEYYEQLAQEDELNECSSLVNAVSQNVKTNNALFELYQKYIPAIRKDNPTAKAYEDQALNLFNLSKSYETSAAKQYSKVEKYTILSEGNELKLQAIANLENAIASYLAMPLSADKAVAANTAPERHNGEALGFDPNESGEDDSNTNGGKKPAQKPAATVADNTQKPAATVADNTQKPADKPAGKSETAQKPATNNANTTSGNKNTNNNTAKPSSNPKNTNTSTAATSGKVKVPVSTSNAPAISTWYYTNDDQRLKPYTYPAGTVFTVETGIYKEMPEPVEFPAVNVFVAEKLKNQTYMRYYLGSYKTYDAALAAQAMAKNGGYKSATLAAFVNGKKTPVATAKASAEKQQGYQSQVQRELKELSAYQQQFEPVPTSNPVQVVAQTSGTTDAQPLSNISGTAYAVQISSVPTLLTKSSFNVNQLYYDQNNGGLYRYYTGVSTDMGIAKANLATMKACGYEDAYIIKVSGGKNVGAVSGNNPQTAANRTIYRVQIGAYKSALSKDNKNKMEKLKRSYAVHTSQSGEYTVYTVGDCDTRAQADKLRAELVKLGYTESYVVTFINGVKQ
ncbi:MAG: SPOR domain-containing protein [Bacteroidales bacterium]|nr:SPOR domain-containing protein [Bacteroidales bacterium]